MQTTMIRVLLLFSLTIGQCFAAVRWRTIGCNGWDFEGTNIDTIWDNAIELANQARSQIDLLPSYTIGRSLKPEQRKAGGDARLIFNVKWTDHRGLDSAGKTTMQTVKSMYGDILAGLQGTLANVDADNAFLFCGGQGLERTPIPGFIGGGGSIWHATIPADKSPTGQIEYITLSYIFPSSVRPCEETGEDFYQAKTFTAVQTVNNVQTRYTGIIICPNQYARMGIPLSATLALNYPTTPAPNNEFPFPDQYNSLSGTLVHEMTHVVGRSRGTQWGDPAGGFAGVNQLAKDNPNANLINPDTYRVYAEMCMSPSTQWGMTFNPPSSTTTTTTAAS